MAGQLDKTGLVCRKCGKMLTKRKAIPLGRAVYCPSDYFQALKKLKKDDPVKFESEVGKVREAAARAR